MHVISINILYEMIYMWMYVCTGAHEGQTLERAVNSNMVIFYILHFSYYSHTECYIIINTIVQTAKLAT